MRRPTHNEFFVFASWGLTTLTSGLMGGSSKVYAGYLWSMYGNRNWPTSTQLYLNSASWFFIIPVALGALILWLWYLGQLERRTLWLQLIAHSLSVTIVFFSLFAASRPHLSTLYWVGE